MFTALFLTQCPLNHGQCTSPNNLRGDREQFANLVKVFRSFEIVFLFLYFYFFYIFSFIYFNFIYILPSVMNFYPVCWTWQTYIWSDLLHVQQYKQTNFMLGKVCKYFYKLVCSNENHQYIFLIYNTKRIFSYYTIHNFKKLNIWYNNSNFPGLCKGVVILRPHNMNCFTKTKYDISKLLEFYQQSYSSL